LYSYRYNAAGFVSEGLANVYGGVGGGSGDGSGRHDLADAIAKRNKHFVSQFTRRVSRVEDKVGASSAALRGQVLNSVIMADASAKSEIPALARAVVRSKGDGEGRGAPFTCAPYATRLFTLYFISTEMAPPSVFMFMLSCVC
jgi:hypothetical protein